MPAVRSAIIVPAMPSVICWDWSSSGLPTSTTPGVAIIDIRLNISVRSVAASWDAGPSNSAMPVTVDGSVPASVVIDTRSSGSGTSPPRVTSMCCNAIWPRAPMARDSACACTCTSAVSARADPVTAVSEVSSNAP